MKIDPTINDFFSFSQYLKSKKCIQPYVYSENTMKNYIN